MKSSLRRSVLRTTSHFHNLVSSLSWALERAECGQLDPQRQADLSRAAWANPAAQLLAACHAMGLDAPLSLATPGEARLPVLCWTAQRGWGVVFDRTASGLWLAVFESGQVSFAELALRNACFSVCSDRRAATVHASLARPVLFRSHYLLAAICLPTPPASWSVKGFAVLALLLGLQLLRHFVMAARQGRWAFLADLAERRQRDRQQRRLARQAISSKQTMPRHLQPAGRCDRRSST